MRFTWVRVLSAYQSLKHLDLAAIHDDGCTMQPSAAWRQDEGGERGDIVRKPQPRHVELAAISLDLRRHVEPRLLHARLHLPAHPVGIDMAGMDRVDLDAVALADIGERLVKGGDAGIDRAADGEVRGRLGRAI